MFTTLIVQPIFNLLVLICAVLPGHNFGLAVILFTIVIRLLMWPLVKKQITQAKAMRELAPEIKKIKQATKGNRQEESRLTMELYKEREINPFASLGVLIVQLPIILGLYKGLQRIISDPHQIVSFSYPFMHHLGWIHQLSGNIKSFDNTLFGAVNLTRTAAGASGVYWAAMVIVVASAIAQYFQTRQLMPQDPDAKGLRQILSEAGKGKQADSSEANAAVGRATLFLMPMIIFLVSLRLAVALPLYWLVSSLTAYVQQSRLLSRDAAIADASVALPTVKASATSNPAPKSKNKKAKRASKKRRKR